MDFGYTLEPCLKQCPSACQFSIGRMSNSSARKRPYREESPGNLVLNQGSLFWTCSAHVCRSFRSGFLSKSTAKQGCQSVQHPKRVRLLRTYGGNVLGLETSPGTAQRWGMCGGLWGPGTCRKMNASRGVGVEELMFFPKNLVASSHALSFLAFQCLVGISIQPTKSQTFSGGSEDSLKKG